MREHLKVRVVCDGESLVQCMGGVQTLLLVAAEHLTEATFAVRVDGTS